MKLSSCASLLALSLAGLVEHAGAVALPATVSTGYNNIAYMVNW